MAAFPASWKTGKWKCHFPDLENHGIWQKRPKSWNVKPIEEKCHGNLFFGIDILKAVFSHYMCILVRMAYGKTKNVPGEIMEKSWSFNPGFRWKTWIDKWKK